jgi:hypothetical protein
VDRVTRSKLKTDRFAVEVEHSVEYVAEHKKQVMMYGAIAVAVACVIAGIWYYRDRQVASRQAELAQAMDIMQAPVGAGAVPGVLFYTTESLKSAAAEKAFKAITSIHARGRFEIPAQGISGDLEVFSARPAKLLSRVTVGFHSATL